MSLRRPLTEGRIRKRKVNFSNTIVLRSLGNYRSERSLLEIIGSLVTPVYNLVQFFWDAPSPSNKIRIWFLDAGTLESKQFLKLFFKTIGVVIDCIQSFIKGVISVLRKVGGIILLLFPWVTKDSLEGSCKRIRTNRTIIGNEDRSIAMKTNYSLSFIAIKMFAGNETSKYGTSVHHGHDHSKEFFQPKVAYASMLQPTVTRISPGKYRLGRSVTHKAQRNQISSGPEFLHSGKVVIQTPLNPSSYHGTDFLTAFTENRNLADSPNRSPLKHRRACLYEKGDYYQ